MMEVLMVKDLVLFIGQVLSILISSHTTVKFLVIKIQKLRAVVRIMQWVYQLDVLKIKNANPAFASQPVKNSNFYIHVNKMFVSSIKQLTNRPPQSLKRCAQLNYANINFINHYISVDMLHN